MSVESTESTEPTVSAHILRLASALVLNLDTVIDHYLTRVGSGRRITNTAQACREYLESGGDTGQPFVDGVNLIGLPECPPYFDELVYVLMFRAENVDLLTRLAPIDSIIDSICRLVARSGVRPPGALPGRAVNARYAVRLAAADTSRRLWTAYDPADAPGVGFVKKMAYSLTSPSGTPACTDEAAAAFRAIEECYDATRRTYADSAQHIAICLIISMVEPGRVPWEGLVNIATYILDVFNEKTPNVRVWLGVELIRMGSKSKNQGERNAGWYARRVAPLIPHAEPTERLLSFLLGPHREKLQSPVDADGAAIRELAKGDDPYAKNVAAWLVARGERWMHAPLPRLKYTD